MDFILAFFLRIRSILTHPVLFFRDPPKNGGISAPLGFALTVHWLGAALGYLWRTAFGSSMPSNWQVFVQNWANDTPIDHPARQIPWQDVGSQMINWFFGLAAVIADPFLTLFALLTTSALVFIGARLLVPAGENGALNEVSYSSALRVICYSMAPSLFIGIPWIGTPLAWVYTTVITILGARETYRVNTFQAILISLFPKLLFIGIIIGGLCLMLLFVFSFMITHW